jgi:predicted MPP superfamily phosphohydrolase
MALFDSPHLQPIARRRFLQAGILGTAALALYSGEIERHWIEISRHDVFLRGLSPAFNGLRIVQLSDIHMDEYTEPFFLRRVVDRINSIAPDAVLFTGDYISYGLGSRDFAVGAAWQCANILNTLNCRQRYAILGNHDVIVGEKQVTAALTASGINVLRNTHLPIERGGGRFWLAGLDDPVEGHPDPELAIPASIRNIPNEPVVLMCHAPDYADHLLARAPGKAVALMLSGHTHGGQVRLPFLGAIALPTMGKRYVEGWFRLGDLQLYVNRGIGTVGLPLRFDCPPEITLFTLRTS